MDKRKVLIIDDEASFMDLVKINLERTGNYTVKAEKDGTKAVAEAKAFLPDVILLDIIMPDVSGDEVAVKLQNDEITKHIPIIFLTAVVKKEEAASGGAVIGGKTFIAKPTSVQELISVIEKNIKNKN